MVGQKKNQYPFRTAFWTYSFMNTARHILVKKTDFGHADCTGQKQLLSAHGEKNLHTLLVRWDVLVSIKTFCNLVQVVLMPFSRVKFKSRCPGHASCLFPNPTQKASDTYVWFPVGTESLLRQAEHSAGCRHRTDVSLAPMAVMVALEQDGAAFETR